MRPVITAKSLVIVLLLSNVFLALGWRMDHVRLKEWKIEELLESDGYEALDNLYRECLNKGVIVLLDLETMPSNPPRYRLTFDVRLSDPSQ